MKSQGWFYAKPTVEIIDVWKEILNRDTLNDGRDQKHFNEILGSRELRALGEGHGNVKSDFTSVQGKNFPLLCAEP